MSPALQDSAAPMEGSGGDDAGAAPDSWETADLEESVSRLMLSPLKENSTRLSSDFPASDFPDGFPARCVELSPPPSSSASAVSAASVRNGGGPPEEMLNQVDQFLREALQNPRERLSVLRMEQDVLKFIRDPTQLQLEFQQLPTSYLRLAAHRVAQHYHLQSVVVPDPTIFDGSVSRILICKTSDRRLPLIRLADIPLCLPQEESNSGMKVAIKQRPGKQTQVGSSSSGNSSNANLTKSVEERKEEYNRARARIFSSLDSASGATGTKPGTDSTAMSDSSSQNSSLSLPRAKENFGGAENNLGRRSSSEHSLTSGSSAKSSRNRAEKEFVNVRHKPNNRVAVFRDQEVDRKDPDYDRSYERYMQRFDPGFGFSGGPYTVQPLYAPAINYNTEFPQLAPEARRLPQIAQLEHQSRPVMQHYQGHRGADSASPTAIGYGPTDSMMAPPPFSPGSVGTHAASSIYTLHSSQYAPQSSRMTFVQSLPFEQTHQQQHEASFGLARPH